MTVNVLRGPCREWRQDVAAVGMNIKDPALHAMAPELAARRSTTVADAVPGPMGSPASSRRMGFTTNTDCLSEPLLPI